LKAENEKDLWGKIRGGQERMKEVGGKRSVIDVVGCGRDSPPLSSFLPAERRRSKEDEFRKQRNKMERL
jgi:hypothetical protein